MTTRHYIELDFTFLLVTAAIIGSTLAFTANHNSKPSSFVIPVIQNIQPLVPNLIPSPKTTSVQQSPDGTKKLTMTEIINNDKTKSYTFVTSDDSGKNQQTIYTTTLPSSESLNIPFNSWSPDNKYVFLEHKTIDDTEAIVFRADAQSFSTDEIFLNSTNFFNARNTGNSYQQATGWAADNLLIINTTQSSGGKGPSYWFEVPSKAIIPLSTEF